GRINQALCVPTEPGMVPDRRIDLLCNLPFGLGATILHGGTTLAIYNDPALADDVIARGVPKIRWRYDESQNGPWTFEPGKVEVVTVDGRKLEASSAKALGHPDK